MAGQLKVYILPGGQVQLVTDGDIAYGDAVIATQQVLEKLGAKIPGFRATSAIEQHRAGAPAHVHVTPRVNIKRS